MRSSEQIRKDIDETKLDIQKRKEMSGDWRTGKDIYDPELIAERDEFFQISHDTNEILKSEKVRIDELNKLNLENNIELELLKEHHKLLLELLMNFFK
jgi:hypothetical protein